MHPVRSLTEFLIWAPPLREFVKRAPGKSWRYLEAQCPVGLLGHGVVVSGVAAWTMQRGRAYFGKTNWHVNASTQRKQRWGRRPARESELPPRLHQTDPCRGPLAKFGRGIFPPQSARPSLVGKYGPRVTRYFAGALCDHDSGLLPPAWNWAAQSLVVPAPLLFDGYFGTVHADSPAVSPHCPQGEMDRNPKPKVNLSTGIPHLPE